MSRYPLSLSARSGQRLPPPLAVEWEWQTIGRCVGHPVEVFFPEDGPRANRRRLERQAKGICTDCPVRAQCLSHALNTPEPHGVWGAMTSSERQQYRTEAAVADRQTVPKRVIA
ncbi:WhiB family transcriptional regulator [Mycobacterium sp. RTGN5]|uniref:WhiB family transcriptional regulator n=1 Tax=Mycobacterium sp. RTGN5 TaxID=3016522 RepID=UPI0029C78D8F|nr:WhiB family transcriptional regulator [Mycobacterium sp. RTGN5]